jgi:hypothetical protein
MLDIVSHGQIIHPAPTKTKATRAPPTRGGGWFQRIATEDPWLTILIVILLAVRTLYAASFPFLIEGDGYTYYHLLLIPHSSLIHAAGYCLFFWPTTLVAAAAGITTGDVLRIAQPLVSAGAVIVLYLGLRRTCRRWLAFAACVVLGTDILQLAAAGTTRPEFFEADVAMMLVGIALLALTAIKVRRKVLLYASAGVLFAAGFVTKFNFLPCGVLLLAPLLDSGLSIRVRIVAWVCGATASLLTLILFVGAFHYPTTGSLHLNLERGWIHMQKLQAAGIPLLPENGLATQKYLALVHALPKIGAGPDPWFNLNAVDQKERAPFRQRFGTLLTSRDTAFVGAELAEFRAGLRPAGDYHDPITFFRLYYYLGLIETEELLADVYDEALHRHFREYWQNVWAVTLSGFRYRTAYSPYLPLPERSTAFYEFADGGFFAPRAKVVEIGDLILLKDADWAIHFWRPGAVFLQNFAILAACPEPWTWSMITAGIISGAWLARRNRRYQPAAIAHTLVIVSLLGMIAFSAIVFVFRGKELIAAHPLIVVLVCLGIQQTLTAVGELRRSVRRGVNASVDAGGR